MAAPATTPLRGRVALVTGGGSGIGRGIALALARRGADLALVGRRAGALAAVAAEATALGVRAASLPADLADTAARDALPGRVRDVLGPPAIVVHAAGVLAGGPILALEAADLDRAVAVNLGVPLALTRALLPDLLAARGAVVLVASLAALVPHPYAAPYSATKAGIAAFGTALRHELAPQGVGVLVAYPPATATAMTRGMARAAGLPGFLLATPEAVGEAIVAALLAGRREWRGGIGERALVMLGRLAPGAADHLLGSQRARFRRMMAAPDREAGAWAMDDISLDDGATRVPMPGMSGGRSSTGELPACSSERSPASGAGDGDAP